jgi:hypothetical protein
MPNNNQCYTNIKVTVFKKNTQFLFQISYPIHALEHRSSNSRATSIVSVRVTLFDNE